VNARAFLVEFKGVVKTAARSCREGV
jgi:hypothetical protein